MADYCSRMIECISYVQAKVRSGRDGASEISLNRHKCAYLAQELSDVLECLQDRGAANLEQSCQRDVLPHLHATVKRAQMLVETCCCEASSRLATALALLDSKEEVMAILSDLHMWTFVLDKQGSASPGGSERSQLQQLLEIGEDGYIQRMQSDIRNAARQDHDWLEEIILSSATEDDDIIRGAYLKARLNHSEIASLESVQELQDYTISGVLGSGSSGMVLEVKWMGQDLALKILKEIDRTEATVLGQVRHPNIVRLFHYWEEITPHPRSCIIMELMATDLQKHIRSKMGEQSGLPSKSRKVVMPFSLPVAIDAMLQVAQAMRELHEKKLTHRDLKTSNILVKPVSEEYLELHSQGYLEVKLADFGSAKAYASTSQTADLTRNKGTTLYGAPEIFEKEKILRERNFPPKADVWSFGMTCSEILTGEVPFVNEQHRLTTLHARIREKVLRPRLPKDCPDYLQFCIKSCWELEPQRRPSFSDLCRMLRYAKLLSLGLMDVESSKYFFAYQISAGVMKIRSVLSLHVQEESRMSRCNNFTLFGFYTKWRNSPRVDSVRSRQAFLSDSGDHTPVHLTSPPNTGRARILSYEYEMLLDV